MMSDTDFYYLLSLIEEGVFILGERREILYMNQAAAHIFEIPACESKTMSFIEAVRDYECDALVQKCISTGLPQIASVKIRGKNRYLDLKVSRSGKQSSNYIVFVKDLSEKHHLEQIRRDFISNVSHEFRTPISSIKLIAETLADGALADSEIYQDFLRKINMEADKLARMTEELTELSSMEKEGVALHKGALKIDALIRMVIRRLQALSDKKNLKIDLDIEPDLPDLIIDQYRIEQVLLNVIHNAIKFTHTGGSISVRVKKLESELLFAVSDTGIGIPADELPRVFERFYKVNKARDDEGSGLGLAISRHIIAAHGGRIWAESVEGKGSTFFFTLPLGS